MLPTSGRIIFGTREAHGLVSMSCLLLKRPERYSTYCFMSSLARALVAVARVAQSPDLARAGTRHGLGCLDFGRILWRLHGCRIRHRRLRFRAPLSLKARQNCLEEGVLE